MNPLSSSNHPSNNPNPYSCPRVTPTLRRLGLHMLLALIAATSGFAAAGSLGITAYPSFSLETPTRAAERSRMRWTPKQEQGKAKGTLSGGRRGGTTSACDDQDDATRLTLLVPKERASLLTTSAHPTLSWQVATQRPTTMEFILSDVDRATPIYTRTLTSNSDGLVSVTLPQDVILKPDVDYRWTVIVQCSEGKQAEIYARSFIRRTSGESLKQQLSHIPALDQAAVFAEHGIWYDAIGQLLAAQASAPQESQQALALLLNQAMPQESETESIAEP